VRRNYKIKDEYFTIIKYFLKFEMEKFNIYGEDQLLLKYCFYNINDLS